jgi:hypothetical protein
MRSLMVPATSPSEEVIKSERNGFRTTLLLKKNRQKSESKKGNNKREIK